MHPWHIGELYHNEHTPILFLLSAYKFNVILIGGCFSKLCASFHLPSTSMGTEEQLILKDFHKEPIITHPN